MMLDVENLSENTQPCMMRLRKKLIKSELASRDGHFRV